jgi:hypothetical protein
MGNPNWYIQLLENKEVKDANNSTGTAIMVQGSKFCAVIDVEKLEKQIDETRQLHRKLAQIRQMAQTHGIIIAESELINLKIAYVKKPFRMVKG